MAILDYPSTYPKPQRASFSAQTNQGVRRVAFESGYSRQRRFFTSQPTEVSLGFVVPYADFKAWMEWVNTNAFVWFNLPVPSFRVAGANLCDTVEQVRFISDLTWRIVGDDHVEVTAAAEFKV